MDMRDAMLAFVSFLFFLVSGVDAQVPTTVTTSTTRSSVWSVTGPCAIVDSERECVASPNWPKPYNDDNNDEGGNCTLRMNKNYTDFGASFSAIQLRIQYDLDDWAMTMILDSDDSPQLLRLIDLNFRDITENDTIYWNPTNTSGWAICVKAWTYKSDGHYHYHPASEGPGVGRWILIVVGVVASLVACSNKKNDKRESPELQEEGHTANTRPDLEACNSTTERPATEEVVQIPADQVQRV